MRLFDEQERTRMSDERSLFSGLMDGDGRRDET